MNLQIYAKLGDFEPLHLPKNYTGRKTVIYEQTKMKETEKTNIPHKMIDA